MQQRQPELADSDEHAEHHGSRSLRGTHVAAVFYTLCETARLAGVDPHVYLLRAVQVAITG